ncbi:hypothetical protein [Allosphingosinicella sp.]|uniref:hypothetical protein n=1 Tax=Allosphingosinicella sp. TaxID=2823234 RepID=UPI002F0C1BA5
MRHSWTLGVALAVALAGHSVGTAASQDPAPAETPAEAPVATLPLADIEIDISDEELAGARTAIASSAPASTAPPTPGERARIAATVERGRLLFELARAAQLTTQDMFLRIPDPTAAGITGWVAERQGNGLTVVYYADGEGGPVAVYRAQLAGGRIAARDVFTGADRPPLTATQRRMAAARSAAAGLDRQPCAGDAPFNVFVIPPAGPDSPIDVYKLTPQTQRARYPLGGHFLASVAGDGSIANIRGFTNRCLDLDVPPVAPGARPAPLAVTHLLDPLPTEIHVFLSLWMNRPLLVATGEPHRLWAVAQGRIGMIGDSAAQTTAGR